MKFIYTKAFAIFASCLAVILLLIFLQIKGWIFPLETFFLQTPRPAIYLVKKITLPVKNFFSVIYHLRKITDENSNVLQDEDGRRILPD